MSGELLQVALTYANLFGWHVLPLKPKGKEPLTPHGVLDATTDGQAIRDWWSRWPDANVGVACGPSRLVVVDVDPHKGGDEAWEALVKRHGFDDDTVTSLTGGGGVHLVFTAPNGAGIRNSAGKLGPGIDVRADGGYVVAPPSIHPNGRPYAWEVNAHPGDRAPAPLPAALLALLTEWDDREEGLGQRAGLSLPDVIPEGERNDTLFRLACAARRPGATESEILALLEAVNAERCVPPLGREELETIAGSAARYEPGRRRSEKQPCKEKEKPPRKNQTDRIIELALDTSLELFLDEGGEPCASIPIGAHREVCLLETRRFKWWLRGLLYRADQKAAYSEAVKGAVGVLAGMAAFEDPTEQILHNRVAWGDDGVLWYDLADERWRAIRITPAGWQVVDEPPNIFRRFKHQAPQVVPEPVPAGEAARELAKLKKYASLAGSKADVLVTAYVGTCFIPDIAHPIPVLYGPQGAGKSATFKALRLLVDPSQIALCSLSRKEENLIQLLYHHWTAYFDNVSYLADWQQDLLCRACTGQGASKRMLYTDDEDVLYSFKRCVGLNGINVVATRGDLLDRSIIFHSERMERYKPEAELWAEFEVDRPRVLGAILTTLSGAMRQGEARANAMGAYFRMADFTAWAYRFLDALDGSGNAFLNAYAEHIKARSQVAIEAHPLGAAVRAFMRDRDRWEGSPSELLSELNVVAARERIDTDSKVWPKSAVWLTRRLNEVKTDLAELGIEVTQKEDREHTLTLSNTGKREQR